MLVLAHLLQGFVLVHLAQLGLELLLVLHRVQVVSIATFFLVLVVHPCPLVVARCLLQLLLVLLVAELLLEAVGSTFVVYLCIALNVLCQAPLHCMLCNGVFCLGLTRIV